MQDKNCLFDEQFRSVLAEALQLRLSIVGWMFDTIQQSMNLMKEFAELLVQLIYYGIIDTNNNR